MHIIMTNNIVIRRQLLDHDIEIILSNGLHDNTEINLVHVNLIHTIIAMYGLFVILILFNRNVLSKCSREINKQFFFQYFSICGSFEHFM